MSEEPNQNSQTPPNPDETLPNAEQNTSNTNQAVTNTGKTQFNPEPASPQSTPVGHSGRIYLNRNSGSQQFSQQNNSNQYPNNRPGNRPQNRYNPNHFNPNNFYENPYPSSTNFNQHYAPSVQRSNSTQLNASQSLQTSPSIELSVTKPKQNEKSTLAFTKSDGSALNIEKKETATKPPENTHQNPGIKIELRKTRPGAKLFDKDHNYQDLLKEWQKLDDEQDSTSLTNFSIKSKGYIILKNYVLETENPQFSRKSIRGRRGPARSVSSNVALVELNSNRFTSSQLVKNIGEWDESSDQAFIMSINQTLNRLTLSNMDESLEEIRKQCSITSQSTPQSSHKKNMTIKERRHFVANTLVDKATKEKSFVHLYAKFTSKFSPEFIKEILEINHATINNCIMNASDESSSYLICNGSAAFFAALAKEKLIKGNDLYKVLADLITEMAEKALPNHIEMFNSFYMSAGPEVAADLEENYSELWDTIHEVMEIPTLKRRLYFLLVDTEEKRNKWLKKSQQAENTNADSSKQTDQDQSPEENLRQVRNAFSVFLESYNSSSQDLTIPDINLNTRDFFYAALDIFTDEIRTFFPFCEFISSVLNSKKASKKDNAKILINRVNRYRELNIETDAPNIWRNLSILIDNMILKNLIYIDEAAEVHSHYPTSPPWDFTNSMKWYLNDYHDFHEKIRLASASCPLEIADALQMPETIEHMPINNFKMSKLICIALIRSLYQKFSYEEIVNLHSFRRYKQPLALAAARYPDVFHSEMSDLLANLEMKQTVENVIDFCKK